MKSMRDTVRKHSSLVCIPWLTSVIIGRGHVIRHMLFVRKRLRVLLCMQVARQISRPVFWQVQRLEADSMIRITEKSVLHVTRWRQHRQTADKWFCDGHAISVSCSRYWITFDGSVSIDSWTLDVERNHSDFACQHYDCSTMAVWMRYLPVTRLQPSTK